MVRVRVRLQTSDMSSTTRRTPAIETKNDADGVPNAPGDHPLEQKRRPGEPGQENLIFSFCLSRCIPSNGAYDNNVPKPTRRPEARLHNAFHALRGDRDPVPVGIHLDVNIIVSLADLGNVDRFTC